MPDSAGPSKRGPLARLVGVWLAASWGRSLVAASVALVVGVAFVTAAGGPIHWRMYGHDMFFLLDNGWRALNGQRVHVDYASGWGPVTFLIVAGGMAVSGASVAAVSYGSAFVALATGLWATWLSAARSRSLSVIVFPLVVAVTAAAANPVGLLPTLTSHAMVYNRYGFALLALVMLASLQPGIGTLSRRRILGEACLTGCAVATMLFLKVTYFLAALPLLGLSIWLWGMRRERLIGFLAGAGATTLLFSAYLHFDLLAMLADLRDAGAARTGSFGHRDNIVSSYGLALAVQLAILAAGCAWFELNEEQGHGPRRAVWVPLATGLAIALDVAFLLTNAQPNAYPVSTLFAAMLLFPIDSLLRSQAYWRQGALLLVVALTLTTPTLFAEGFGLVRSTVEARLVQVEPDVARFEAPRLRPLIIHDGGPHNRTTGRNYVNRINDGVRLLESKTSASDRISTLEMFEPFSYTLGRRPVRGGIAAAAYKYTLDDEHHPSADRFFADADVVMVPKLVDPDAYHDAYVRIYTPTLEKRFVFVAESVSWRLYRRRENAAPGH